MAPRKGSQGTDDDAAEEYGGDGETPGETSVEDVSLEEASLDEAFDEGEDDGLDEEFEEDPTELSAAPVEEPADEPVAEVGEPGDAVTPPDATFDDEDDEGIVAAVTGEDGDEGLDVEGLQAGEFVCRSCYIAKRDTQLADPERLLCRDCA